ncbi:hypothetical protein GOP47_0026157, partial [Adiantum capillus-veneris]
MINCDTSWPLQSFSPSVQPHGGVPPADSPPATGPLSVPLAKGGFPQATPPCSSLSPHAITGGSFCSAITLLLSGGPSLSSLATSRPLVAALGPCQLQPSHLLVFALGHSRWPLVPPMQGARPSSQLQHLLPLPQWRHHLWSCKTGLLPPVQLHGSL